MPEYTYRPYGAKVRKQYPCPGCGKPQWAPATELCRQCRREIDVGRNEIARLQHERDTGERVLVRIGTTFLYDSPAGDVRWQKPSEYRGVHLVRDLAALADMQQIDHPWGLPAEKVHYTGDRAEAEGWVTPENLERLRRILDYVAALAAHKYQEGHHDGRSLLAGMASGELTVKEFNEQSLRAEKGT